MASSAEIREKLATELRLDLIGPGPSDGALVDEVLPDPPSRWYLTGFLMPLGAPERQKSRDAQEEMDTAEEGGADDGDTPDRGPARPRYLPSSMGMSLLVEPGTEVLRVTARWGDYRFEEPVEENGGGNSGGGKDLRWRREQREVTCDVPLEPGPPIQLPDTDGLEIARHIRQTRVRGESGDRRVIAVSLFLVNRRAPSLEPGREDEAMAFQAELEVESTTPIVARIDLSGRDGDDIDARIADLHYRDIVDWAVGHNVSVAAEVSPDGGTCHSARTCWLPSAFVPRFIPGEIGDVELGMDGLASLADGAAAKAALENLPARYRDWIELQQPRLAGLSQPRREMAETLLADARRALRRIEDGIGLLADLRVLDAFRLMNEAIAAAARRRRPGEEPRWYPFQLAFILMNLRGIVETRTRRSRDGRPAVLPDRRRQDRGLSWPRRVLLVCAGCVIPGVRLRACRA